MEMLLKKHNFREVPRNIEGIRHLINVSSTLDTNGNARRGERNTSRTEPTGLRIISFGSQTNE